VLESFNNIGDKNMNAMEKFCSDQQKKIDELREELYTERQKHRAEVLALRIDLVHKNSELETALYRVNSLEKTVEMLQGCVDREHKRRMEDLSSDRKWRRTLSKL